MKISMIGLDLAKSVFQVHGIDSEGQAVLQRRLRRGEVESFFRKLRPAVVGMESCGGAHHWARLLRSMGHEVRLMPPAYVKPYVRRNKTDGRDAEAICEAMQRPNMRFVGIKSTEQQAVLALHRTRSLLVRQRTMAANAFRAVLAEFGVVARQGRQALQSLMAESPATVPQAAHAALASLARHWRALDADIAELEERIVRTVKSDPVAQRLIAIPGVGPIIAGAVVATVPDARVFRSGRGFAAWLGLTPRQNNSAGRRRTGGISKQGDRMLRTLLIVGASSHLRHLRRPRSATKDQWLTGLLARKPVKVACVARAAKTARIIWAMLARNEAYTPRIQRAA